jgi:hypothetical protein
VTLVGFSKGADIVMNYISAKHNGQLTTGPDVRKYVLIGAPEPGGPISQNVGGTLPGAPFETPFSCSTDTCAFGDLGIQGFTGGQVVNLWSPQDWLVGNMGSLSGAFNLMSAETPHDVGYGRQYTHGHSQVSDAIGAFGALDVNGDSNAYYEGSH